MPRNSPRFNPLFSVPPGQSLPLNDLEKTVLGLYAQGYRSSEIARRLAYSAGHIRNTQRSATQKLEQRTITGAVVAAMQQGQISRLLRRPDRDS